MEQFDLVTAMFQPQRTDDLKLATRHWVGWRGIWEAAWLIEDGPYNGQWACIVHPGDDGPPASAFVWTPQCDLADVQTFETLTAERLEELKEALPKPHVNYVPDF